MKAKLKAKYIGETQPNWGLPKNGFEDKHQVFLTQNKIYEIEHLRLDITSKYCYVRDDIENIRCVPSNLFDSKFREEKLKRILNGIS